MFGFFTKGNLAFAAIALIIGLGLGHITGQPIQQANMVPADTVAYQLSVHLYPYFNDDEGRKVVISERVFNRLLGLTIRPSYRGLYTEGFSFDRGHNWSFNLRDGYFLVLSTGNGGYEVIDTSHFCGQNPSDRACRTRVNGKIVLESARTIVWVD